MTGCYFIFFLCLSLKRFIGHNNDVKSHISKKPKQKKSTFKQSSKEHTCNHMWCNCHLTVYYFFSQNTYPEDRLHLMGPDWLKDAWRKKNFFTIFLCVSTYFSAFHNSMIFKQTQKNSWMTKRKKNEKPGLLQKISVFCFLMYTFDCFWDTILSFFLGNSLYVPCFEQYHTKQSEFFF